MHIIIKEWDCLLPDSTQKALPSTLDLKRMGINITLGQYLSFVKTLIRVNNWIHLFSNSLRTEPHILSLLYRCLLFSGVARCYHQTMGLPFALHSTPNLKRMGFGSIHNISALSKHSSESMWIHLFPNSLRAEPHISSQ